MRSLPLTLLAVLGLLTPAAALAAPAATSSPARLFEIHALAFGDGKLEITGKIGFEGDQLSASVGCNLIGGKVTVDGDAVTIVGPTSMTEMACIAANGDAEKMLLDILGLRRFTITKAGWVADGGQIVTVEMTGPGPVPAGSPPDEPVSSSPAAKIVEPAPNGVPSGSCPPVPVDENTTAVDAGPPFGGSGGGTTWTGVATAATAVANPGGGPVVVGPGATPRSVPGATAIEPPPPALVPGQTFSLGQGEPEPSLGIIRPDPIGQDPNVGKPADPCGQGAGGAVAAPAAAAAKTDAMAVAEHAARDAADRRALVVPLAVVLGVLVLLGARIYRRRRPTSR